MKKAIIKVLLSGTACGAAMATQPASAQAASEPGQAAQVSSDTPATLADLAQPSVTKPSAESPSGQNIVVTGSRIPQPNLTSASPVTVITSNEIKLEGTSRIEDLINSLPQSFAAQGSNLSNGASGTATINLRNLGANRTLVLINGRRLNAGDPLTPVPDINFIPTQLVKRVEVLTGGASSVYGADAVGGVVNFILDDKFTGLRIDAQASTFQHYNIASADIIGANRAAGFTPPHGLTTNGGAVDVAGVFGASFNDGRGHVQAYGTYRKQRPVLQSTRDYSFCSLSGLPSQDPTPGAHSVGATGRLFDCAGSLTSDPTNIFTNTGSFSVGPNGTLSTTPSLFNFAPLNYYQRPDERYTAGAFADYDVSSALHPYFEAMFMDDRSTAQIAPAGVFFGNIRTINCDNALLSANELATICQPANIVGSFNDPVTGRSVNIARAIIGRRNVEGGGRIDELQHTDFRIVAGTRGELTRGISYDASYQFGRVNSSDTHLNDFSITRLGRALDVIDNPNTPGFDPTCRSVLDGTDPNCVPYNVFGTGPVTDAALKYLQVPGLERGSVQESIAHADVTFSGTELGIKSPFADNGIGLNVGAEYRKEASKLTPDVEFQTGDLAGNGGATPPVDGQFTVRELFGETQIPIIEHRFIELLQVSAGYRYSDYKVASNSFKTDTFKLAAEFAPIRDVRFRAAYNRAVRAPNIAELFSPQAVGLAGTQDPCAGTSPTATAQQCGLTGVTTAQYGHILANPANQYNGLLGGNPNLTPEKADTFTAGVILQPRFIPGLALTADYFDIKVKNLISTEAYSSVFQQCFGGDTAECRLVHRDNLGSLFISPDGFVTLTSRNFPGVGLLTKGIDFSGTYSRKLGSLGVLSANFVGTLLGKSSTIGGADVGHFSPDSIPVNKWRHKARLGIELPNGVGVSTQWRHFSPVTFDTSSTITCGVADGCPTPVTVPVTTPADSRVKAQDYFDLAVTARVTKKLNFRVGANNLFDRAPPVVGSEVLAGVVGNGNTWPQIYDALGRYIFAGVTADF